MIATTPTRIVILGGGFGGLYTALELEKTLARRRDIEIVLVNAENFFLFTPMLHEVAASDLDAATIVNPIRKLLKRVKFFAGECESIDLERRLVRLRHGDDRHDHEVAFDHLVVALGSVTNFYGLPGVEAASLTMKSLSDAISLRNRVISNLEEADFECCASKRARLLTFVVAGGGFAGVETAASLHDFVLQAIRFYPNLDASQVRMVLVHSGSVILPELSEELGVYARRKLEERGVEIRTEVRVAGYAAGYVQLTDGESIETTTLVWTAGTSPNPLLETLACLKERGRISVDESLAVRERPGVWALGDCAVVPNPETGRPHPPTAQHAIRQGRQVARNIIAALEGRPPAPFRFRTIGQLASLGRRSGVAKILGINFSGFLAWWLWRTVYLSKLPRLERKVRVALDWTLDLLFTKDLVQLKAAPATAPAAAPTVAPTTPAAPAAAPKASPTTPAAAHSLARATPPAPARVLASASAVVHMEPR